MSSRNAADPVPDRAPMARMPLLTAMAILLLAGCDDIRFPQDPDGTLDRVLRTGIVRVAAVDHVPWVIVRDGDDPAGAEADLVRAFADRLGVRVHWVRAPAFEALSALRRRDVDLAIGGFPQEAVTMHTGAAHTFAYATESLLIAAPPGMPVPEDLDGAAVVADPALMAETLIARKGGRPVTPPGGADSLVAVRHWQAPALGLVPTAIVLDRHRQVVAVPQGENAWIMRVEAFLRDAAGDMDARLRRHAEAAPR